ncbi:MAG: hypothetical protein C4533_00595 [Candidatus Omnitrophota bacterium]|jgi:type II secretory pathway pseudopilin PulG|nr:MAG: hypothetical protein C4533_00595 [Candidatus Omnitrophota bacterium]
MKRGLTLIEILVASSILILLILAVFQVMEAGRSAVFTGDLTVQLRQEIIRTFMRMERELKEARPALVSLTSGNSSSTITFSVPQDINGDGTVLDDFGAIEWSAVITYALNGSNQIIRTSSGVTNVLANDIVSLQFSRPLSPVNILQIDMTARKISSSGRQLQDAGQMVIEMRN